MNKFHCLGLLLAALATDAAAQDATCPGLPADSTLHWEQKAGDGFTLCRAMDGERQVLGMMLTAAPTVKLQRRKRGEEGRIGAYPVYWYQPDVVADTSADRKRITVVELGEDRYAQVWIDADSPAELQRLLAVAQGIALY